MVELAAFESEALIVALVSMLGFVSTNLDSLLLLVAWLGSRSAQRGRILLGYIIGIGLVLLASWAISRVADLFPAHLIGWLGVVPIALGLYGLVGLLRSSAPTVPATHRSKGLWAAILVTLSISGDNLSVFIPLFADTHPALDPMVAVSALVCAIAWGFFALQVAKISALQQALERWGRIAMPLLLIALGTYILADSPTDLP